MSPWPEVAGPSPAEEPALAALLARLRAEHRDAVQAVLLYGSCLRSGDLFDGLVDLYLVVDSYRDAYGAGWLALANRLLPPNVFYAQCEVDGRVLRSKVTVVSLADFRRGCSRRWYQSYLWGRFSQPVRIIHARNDAVAGAVSEAFRRAATTLLTRALPALPASGTLADLWEQALALSYGTELRTERPGRARELVSAALPFYAAVTQLVAPDLPHTLSLSDSGERCRYRATVAAGQRRLAPVAWGLRRLQGKSLSVARLVKALFTFSGGLDYIAWKLERHSGEPIEIPPRVRRHPLLFSWGFFWRLYRRGVFR
ncbi:phosphatidate cytidylyltransferase [Pseudohaliea rubra]|uniref:Uncharacterized protein n=1 Tax=Pseudohaliea rubra DSM 19751 TaxID=1265313 RepID=A0A095WZC8_9GAMM|nr:hypothetical protein [Pseudohaliea rubra]KGE03989.1 hypothetical protein HRUBRA_01494 [Pseudohaliea rubra DSM 19751]